MPEPAMFAEIGDAFEQGKAAMEANGSWLVPTHTAAGKDLGFEFGIAPLPKGPAGRFTSVNPTGAVVYKGTKAPDAAWEFVKYLASPAAQEQLMQLHASLPVSKEVLAGPYATLVPGRRGVRGEPRLREAQAVVRRLQRVHHACSRESWTRTCSTSPRRRRPRRWPTSSPSSTRSSPPDDPSGRRVRAGLLLMSILRRRAVRGPVPRRRGGPVAAETRWAWVFLAPTLIGLTILSAGPILATLGISLTRWDLLTAPQWVGLGNFSSLLSDERFIVALRNTTFYTVVSVPLGIVLALGLSLALNHAIRGIAWIRTAYFLPLVTSATAVGLVWAWIYAPSGGILNQLIAVLGMPPQKWISDPFWAMPAIILMSTWQGLGVSVIIFLAGLQGVPQEYYDAAAVDGAGRWSRFRNVTLPLLTPSIFFTGILALISAFQIFDQVYVLARPGKPTDATVTLVYFIYENGFKNFKMGYAAAASWIMFLIVAVLTWLYFRSQRRWVHYQ